MPRSGPNGTYTLPGAQDEAQPNTTIQSSINNQGWADIEQTFNTVQPIPYGGTGQTDLVLPADKFGIKDSVDDSKRVVFDLSGVSASTTRTLTIPDKDGTVATTADVDALFDGDLGKSSAEQARARANIGLTKWSQRAIGEIVYVDTSLTGVEIPPDDAGFIELTAGLTGSGQYNEGKLTSETISGSGATLTATAVIDDDDSPMDGQTIRLLNSEERVVYAGARAKSGNVFNDQMQEHEHDLFGGNTGGDRLGSFANIATSTGTFAGVPMASGGVATNNRAKAITAGRAGDRTRAKGQFFVAFLKYKDVA